VSGRSGSQDGRRSIDLRRLEAADLFECLGLSLAEISRRLHVSRETVSRWHRAWRQGGLQALGRRGRLGRKPRLSQGEFVILQRALELGARAHGYPDDEWSVARLGQLIERLTGVRYHRGHVWRLLRRLTRESPPETRRPARR
jgi:transposase